MQYRIEKNYLVFPVSRFSKNKKLVFRNAEGECVLSLDIKIDYISPEYDAYIDMKRFRGEILDICTEPFMKLEMRAKDRRPVCRFREASRPDYHFTETQGYMGKVCGAVFSGGMYHIFYLHNPAGTDSGNIHFSHAQSKNLLDWEFFGDVIFGGKSGKLGSGCPVLDEKNLLGTKTDEKTPVVFLYNLEKYAACEESEEQTSENEASFPLGAAVSTDNCESFTKIPTGPAVFGVSQFTGGLSAVFSKTLDIYVMCLHIEKDKFAVMTSANLLDWQKKQEIVFPQAEACVFFPISCEKGEKWVFMSEDDRYILGDFDGESFVSDTSGVQRFNYSRDTLSSLPVLGLSDERCIRFVSLPSCFERAGLEFEGVLGFPQELTCEKDSKGMYRLFVKPCSAHTKLRGKKMKDTFAGKEINCVLRGTAQEINLEILPLSAKNTRIDVFGISIELDFEKGTLSSSEFTCPVKISDDGKIRIKLLFDAFCVEFYTSDGEAYLATGEIPDGNLSVFSAFSDNEITLKLEAFRLRAARKADRRK